MLEFILRENIDHYLSMLMNPDVAPAKQLTLQRLLVEEQAKSPRDQEQLELAERRIRQCKDHIKTLKTGVADSDAGDSRAQQELMVVAALQAVQGELERFCRTLRDELEPFVVMLRTTAVAIFRTLDEAKTSAQRFANANPGLVVVIIDRSTGDSHVVQPE
jgi:hypothetical protein